MRVLGYRLEATGYRALVRSAVVAAWAVVLAAGLASGAAADSAGFYYRVQRGDSLDVVAHRFKVSAYDIARDNRLGVKDKLASGTQIWVRKKRENRESRVGSRESGVGKKVDQGISAPRKIERSEPVASSDGGVVVRPGDSLWKIASAHGTTVNELARANGISPQASLRVGQELRLPGEDGESNAVKESGPAAESEPIGQKVRDAFLEAGGYPLFDEAKETPKEEKPEPVSEPIAKSKPAARRESGWGSTGGRSASAPSEVSPRGYSWPLEGRVIRSFEDGLTSKHAGLDISSPVGTPVCAARDGRVIYAGDTISAYGNMVIIKHDERFSTCYAFNSRLRVKTNDMVKRGEVIAESGDEGKGGRPYLYFQLRRSGDAVDPTPYLP